MNLVDELRDAVRRKPDAPAVADLVADLVSILPPRGHAFHNLATWQKAYSLAAGMR